MTPKTPLTRITDACAAPARAGFLKPDEKEGRSPLERKPA
jgi:hypothetical protein